MAKNNPDERDRLIRRISECEQVIHDLENNKAWEVVSRDLKEEREQLDDNWQNIWDNEKLLAARVLKFACKHILDLRQKYKDELEENKKTLKVLENPKEHIIKDYDIE